MFLHKVIRMNQNRAVVLPQTLAREFGIEYGDYVFIEAHKDGILIQKVVRIGNEVRVSTTRHDPRAKT